MRPMILKSSVRASRKTSGNTPCMREMTAVMSCWKNNAFSDLPCRDLIEEFVQCSQQARAKRQARQQLEDGHKYPTEEVNRELRRFAWAQ